MLELDQATLRRLQLTELELLQEADRICRKNGIRYNIIAGTLLGAVRHGGFIPWDDDADIALLREDYERFRSACMVDLDPSRFYFQDHATTPGYRWGYGKLRRKDTLFLRENQEHMPYEQGVFIDVFPLDPVPESRAGRSVVNFTCFLIRKMLWSKVGKRADSSGWKRLLYRMLDRIPEKKILSMYDRLIKRAGKWKSSWVRILMFPTPNRQYGYLRSWYETSEPILFEGAVFSGIKDRDAYLRFKYRDYMTLPPKEQRKTHPVSDICLIKSDADRVSG